MDLIATSSWTPRMEAASSIAKCGTGVFSQCPVSLCPSWSQNDMWRRHNALSAARTALRNAVLLPCSIIGKSLLILRISNAHSILSETCDIIYTPITAPDRAWNRSTRAESKKNCPSKVAPIAGNDSTDTESEPDLGVFRAVHVRSRASKVTKKVTNITKVREAIRRMPSQLQRVTRPSGTSQRHRTQVGLQQCTSTLSGPASTSATRLEGQDPKPKTLWYCGHCHHGPMSILLVDVCVGCMRRRDQYA